VGRLRSERGAVAVLAALAMVLLLTMVALAVDVGSLMLRRREMVNGTDASALAAALTYVNSGSMAGVKTVADKQFRLNSPGSVNDAPGGIVSSVVLEPGSTKYAGSMVVTYRTLQPLHFAPVFGFSDATAVTTTATASWKGGGVDIPQVQIPTGYGSQAHDKVYVCKYVGKPGQNERLASGQNPILVNYNENWNGQTLFLDAQGYSVVIALHDTPGPGPDPEPTCPDNAPRVWLSN
jgi:Putative Flp pilus-assembly TadE/G-like